jgi:Protein of unknown function (DUF1302)
MARIRPRALARLACACGALAASNAALAGSLDLFGIPAEYKLTLGYATAMRMEDADPALIDGPIDVMQVSLNTNPVDCPTLPTPCVGSFGHTGMPTTVLFDDGDRDFKKHARLNDRISAYTEWQFKLDNFGIGDVGVVASAAAHYDKVFLQLNDNDSPETVNRHMPIVDGRPTGNPREWTEGAVETNGRRARLLESYAYGQWYLTDTMGLSLRAGKHLAAWGESLFFPGIVSAQGPFDATKANVPGVEVKEILLPVNQVSMQMSVTDDITVLAYNQFEFDETEIYPQGDFFSPADLVGPGATFGYGSINPLHEDWCDDTSRVQVTNDPTMSGQGLCQAGDLMENKPAYIMTLRTPDQRPDSDAEKKQYGLGLKYALTPNFNLGGYYIKYNNHNPGVRLNMGYAFVGDVAGSCGGSPPDPNSPSCQHVTTEQFNVKVPVSYTVTYADDITMKAVSFSTVFWVFNIGGEIIRRENVDTSVEATISGVVAPVGTRGDTTTAQMSFLYVNNPDFLFFDEVVVVGEMGYTQVDSVKARRNEDGICYTGAEANNDCDPGKPDDQYVNYGDKLFYDKNASAIQMLILPKGRNVFAGWDISTPINFGWLIDGTPSTPGVFGALYGEGDMRVGFGVTGQFLQNFELALSYNAFLGDANKHIGNSTLSANPYVDHDYLAFSAKYNL